MRVGVVMDRLTTGGTERQTELLVRELSPHVAFEVCAFGATPESTARFESLAPVTLLARGTIDDFHLPRRVRKWADSGKLDLVFAPHRFSGLVAKSAKIWGLRQPVVCAVRGYEEPSIWRSFLYARLDMLAMRAAAAVVINANVVRDRMPAWSWLQAKLHYIPNGLERAEGPSGNDRLAARTALGFNERDLVLASVGRLVEVKAPLLAAEATQQLTKLGYASKLLWIGDGPLRHELEQKFASQPLDLRCTGFVDDVPNWLAAADIYVHPARWENTSNAILEAMASALPVVARAVGGNPEVLNNGELGLLFGSDNELIEQLIVLAESPPKRIDLGMRASEDVRTRFSAHAMAQQHLELFEACLST